MSDPWTMFAGRKQQLSELCDNARVALGGQPTVISIIAESGTGKTRLAQELYANLAAMQKVRDGQRAYWPPRLDSSGGVLKINPKFEDVDPPQVEMPWLWWGIRGKDPKERNASEAGSAVNQALEHLNPHLAPIALREVESKVAREALKKGGEAVANIFSLGWAAPLLALLSASEMIGARKEYRDRLKTVSCSIAERSALGQSDQNALVIESLVALLRKDIPVAILADDYHFFDENSSRLVSDLLNEVKKIENAKFLLVVTSWRKEWLEGVEKEHSIAKWDGNRIDMDLRRAPHSALLEILLAHIPRLDVEDATQIRDRSGGNLRYLIELIRALTGDSDYYLDDVGEKVHLSKAGKDFIQSRDVDFDSLVRERFSKTPSEVTAALAVGSAQGASFDAEITSEVVGIIRKLEASDALNLIARGESPYSLIAAGAQGTKEFLEGPYWNEANRRLKNHPQISEEEVRRSYADLISRKIQTSNPLALSARQIAQLEWGASHSTDPNWTCSALGALICAYEAKRRFEPALRCVIRLGEEASGRGNSVWRWPETEKTNSQWSEWSKSALRVISHFGWRGSKRLLTGSQLEDLGTRIDGSLNLWIESNDQDLTMAALVDAHRAKRAFYSSFGHVLHEWNSNFQISQLLGDKLLSGGENFSLAGEMIMCSLDAIEQRVTSGRYDDLERLHSESLKDYGRLVDTARDNCPNHLYKLLESSIVLHRFAVFSAALPHGIKLDEEDFRTGFYSTVNDLADFLYQGSFDTDSLKTLKALSDNTPLLLLIALRACDHALEIATRHGIDLQPTFTRRVEQLCLETADLLTDGSQISLNATESAVQACLSIAIHADVFGERTRSSRLNDLLSRGIADGQRRFPGSLKLLVLESRHRILNLDLQARDGIKSPNNALAVFRVILEHAFLAEDPKRTELAEPSLFLEWLIKACFLHTEDDALQREAVVELMNAYDVSREKVEEWASLHLYRE